MLTCNAKRYNKFLRLLDKFLLKCRSLAISKVRGLISEGPCHPKACFWLMIDLNNFLNSIYCYRLRLQHVSVQIHVNRQRKTSNLKKMRQPVVELQGKCRLRLQGAGTCRPGPQHAGSCRPWPQTCKTTRVSAFRHAGDVQAAAASCIFSAGIGVNSQLPKGTNSPPTISKNSRLHN
jgi:hypothetical protein